MIPVPLIPFYITYAAALVSKDYFEFVQQIIRYFGYQQGADNFHQHYRIYNNLDHGTQWPGYVWDKQEEFWYQPIPAFRLIYLAVWQEFDSWDWFKFCKYSSTFWIITSIILIKIALFNVFLGIFTGKSLKKMKTKHSGYRKILMSAILILILSFWSANQILHYDQDIQNIAILKMFVNPEKYNVRAVEVMQLRGNCCGLSNKNSFETDYYYGSKVFGKTFDDHVPESCCRLRSKSCVDSQISDWKADISNKDIIEKNKTVIWPERKNEIDGFLAYNHGPSYSPDLYSNNDELKGLSFSDDSFSCYSTIRQTALEKLENFEKSWNENEDLAHRSKAIQRNNPVRNYWFKFLFDLLKIKFDSNCRNVNFREETPANYTNDARNNNQIDWQIYYKDDNEYLKAIKEPQKSSNMTMIQTGCLKTIQSPFEYSKSTQINLLLLSILPLIIAVIFSYTVEKLSIYLDPEVVYACKKRYEGRYAMMD